MDYMHELASIALKSIDSKKFTIEDGHEMTITPAGDGKTMRINIDDGVSYKTKGANDFIKKIEEILTNRGVTGWDEMRAGQDSIGQVLAMYKDEGCAVGNVAHQGSKQRS